MKDEFVEEPELKKKMKLVGESEGSSEGKMEKTKKAVAEKKEDMGNKIQEMKEGASKKKEDIQEGIEETKKEVKEQKEKLEKESKEEGMTPAEKILNDIVTRFREGTGQINDAISDRGTESEKTKKPLVEKPLVDVIETNDTVTIIADISGLKKDDIDIGISKNRIEITAMFKEEPEDEEIKFTKKERSYGKTHRKIMLESEVKVHEAKANYKNCTLTITIPKTVEDITKVNID